MMGAVVFKKYHELREPEIEKLFQFCRSFRVGGFYDQAQNMKNYLGGPLLQGGHHHLSCWKDGEPLVSVGWIDREVISKKELYLTHGFSCEEGLAYWQAILDQIGAEMDLNGLVVKMGLRGENNALEAWATEQRWTPLYNMLKMSKSLERQAPTEDLDGNAGNCYEDDHDHDGCSMNLRLEDLTQATWETFLRVHNGGFEQVPNGGLLDFSERDELMSEYAESRGRLLLGFEEGQGVAMAMLKIFEEEKRAHLEALSIDPQHHGKGYGKRMMKSLVRLLQQEHPTLSILDLMVMDANVRAHGLYAREGFQLDCVEVKWYGKDPQAE